MPENPDVSAAGDPPGSVTVAGGFIVHCYPDPRRSRVNVLGRLSDGRSFAAAVPAPSADLFVRASEFPRLRELSLEAGLSLSSAPAEFTAFDGGECVAVFPGSGERGPVGAGFTDRLSLVARRAGISLYGGDARPAREFLLRGGIRAGVRVTGAYRPGRGVDLVFPAAGFEAAHSQRAPLVTLSFDIETEEPSGVIRVVSLVVARGPDLSAPRIRRVIAQGPWKDAPALVSAFGAQARDGAGPADDTGLAGGSATLLVAKDERSLLEAFSSAVRELDPDLITGWNVIDFDFPRLAAAFSRNGLPFTLGRSLESGAFFPAERGDGDAERSAAVFLPGRQVVDGLRLVRAGGSHYDSYALDAVAHEVLGRGKTVSSTGTDKLAELDRLYFGDPVSLFGYCLADSELVLDILGATGLLTLTIERAALTGAGIDKAWTSVASFECVYSLGLRERKVLEPAVERGREVSGAAGGTVLDPLAGMYRNVAVFDFRSLYPSIIRTFNIDPLAHERARHDASGRNGGLSGPIVAPNGAAFVREPGILPALIGEYFSERLAAIGRGDENAAYAYKILMNSFYGVLGSARCRYARTELAGAITSFGKMCLHFARDYFAGRGLRVLYGDTDSVFVEIPEGGTDSCGAHAEGLNAELAARVSTVYRRESFLSIRFEKLYRRFFIPRLRADERSDERGDERMEERDEARGEERADGAARGRAKGYAGLRVMDDGSTEVEIKGMEAARSDYTPLARRIQRELLAILFASEGVAEAEEYLRREAERLYRGELDGELVFKKRLRREPDSYTASTPPHIKVARSLGWTNRRGTVEYLMTVRGPEAVSLRASPLDYEWYIASQVLPLARSAGLEAGFDAEAILASARPGGQIEFGW